MSTPLTTYMSNIASVTLSSANKLYSASGAPANNATYTTIGNNVTGWVELVPQGAPVGNIFSSIQPPTGNGFLWDVTTLEGQQLLAGNWSGNIRLNAAQGAGNPQAGTLTGDIVRRAFRRTSSGFYSTIVVLTLAAQTLNFTFTTYALPTTAGSSMIFGTGDKLYEDCWFNCTANANGSALQGVRMNRLSTDIVTFLGDPTTQLVTPGYQAAPAATPIVARNQARKHFGRQQ